MLRTSTTNRSRPGLWLLLCLGAGCAAIAGGRTDSRSLFDGESLAGWDGDRRFWSVQDGVLVGESTEAQPLERTTYLTWTRDRVADFELVLEVRITGGNSGVQFRSRAAGDWQVAGYQADLDAASQWTGGIYEQDGRGVIARHGERVQLGPDGAKDADRFAPDEDFVFAEGVWHSYRITAVGERITLAVDGVETCELIDRAPEARSSGRIALQLHQGAPMRVEYRDIRLTHLGGELAQAEPREPRPAWIWSHAAPEDAEDAWFRRAFEVREGLVLAQLWATCDNRMELSVNRDRVAESDAWERPLEADVLDLLRIGTNELFAWTRNDGGPAGLCVALELHYADGERVVVFSDESWLSARTDPGADRSHAAWEPVHDFGELGVEPWGELGTGAAAESEAALEAAELELPPGFTAERLYSVPRVRQGSWVSLAADDRGRLYASDQYGGLYRITPPPFGDEAPTRVEPLDVDLGEAHGLLWAFDSLYVVVCAAGSYESGLYRLRDTNGDDRLDLAEQLAVFDGDGEHGPHSVRVGPDGQSLYVVAGNHTALPALARSLVPELWDEDALLARISDPGGHAVGKLAPGGWICRTDPDGREWELFASGFRNPYDIDFDGDGELFTWDADMEWDIGLPWYRPPRVLHVVSGAEFGWRTGSGKWPAYYPDSLPAVVDLGPASPTGVEFGTRARFPERWRRALIAADWSYGTIFAIHLEPRGASYIGTAEPFVSGRPLPVTDVAFGPDGALYFTTGGRRTQSGLYRVTWTGVEPALSAEPAEAATPARSAERLRRRAVEDFHGRTAPDLAPFVWESLGDADRHVRFAARTALEFQPVERWQERALFESEPRASVQAMLALVRVGGGSEPERVLARLAEWPWSDFDRDTFCDALRVVGLALLRLDATPAARAPLAAVLAERFPTGDDTVDPELCRVLVALEDPRVLAPALERLEAADEQATRIAYTYALRELRTGWTAERLERFGLQLDDLLTHATGGNSVTGYLERIRSDAVANVGLEPVAAELVEVSAAPPEPLEIVRHWQLNDLTPYLDQVAAERSYENGRAAYARAQCVDCHRLGGIGKAEGPDLTGAGNRYTPRDLAESILSPSLVISDTYLDTEVWTRDERVHVGRIEEIADGAIRLRTAAPASVLVEIPLADVAERRPSPLSRMPENLLDTLTREEILDLLAFVLAGGEGAE